MGDQSIENLENSSIWTLNHIHNETRDRGTVKGLVTGSVQSGKTANMEALISMAADYGWNFFIILSGTIDNLRKQTQKRFAKDLKNTLQIAWKVIDFTKDEKKYSASEMILGGKDDKTISNRYLTVCLKNKARLERLTDWLYSDIARARKLRVIVIDDESRPGKHQYL